MADNTTQIITLYEWSINEFITFDQNSIEEILFMEKDDSFYNDKVKSTPRSIIKSEEEYIILNKPNIYYKLWNKEIEDNDIIWYISEDDIISKNNPIPKIEIMEIIKYIKNKYGFKNISSLDTYLVDGIIMKDDSNHEIILLDLRAKYKHYDITLIFNGINESVGGNIKDIKDIDIFIKKELL